MLAARTRSRLPTRAAGILLTLAIAAPAAAAIAAPASPDGAGADAAAPRAASAAAAPPLVRPSTSDLAARAEGIADDAVARWVSRQDDSGRFADPLAGSGGDYGTAMLGLAMARRGLRVDEPGLVRRGLEAVRAQVTYATGGAFELLALSRAYRFGMRELETASTPDMAAVWRQFEPALRSDLASRSTVGEGTVGERCLRDPDCWNNVKLVESTALLELLGTQVPPAGPNALIARPGLRRIIYATARQAVDAQTGRRVIRRGPAATKGAGILSDPPRDPLAYHALSTAMLGDLLDDMGEGAPRAGGGAFDRAARALLLLSSPGGDASWYGRGQGQVWVPAMTAEAAAHAAVRTRSDVLRGRYLALCSAALDRLRRLYGISVAGLPLVPGATDPLTLASRGIDGYATTRGYNGLAVHALDRTAELLRRISASGTSLPSERTGTVRAIGQAGIATITRGDLWVAFAAASRSARDSRYSSGLHAVELRRGDAGWQRMLPAQPIGSRVATLLAQRDGAGRLLPTTGQLGTAYRTNVEVVGGFAPPGRRIPRRDVGTRFRWSVPDDRTIELAHTSRAARTLVLSALLAGGDVVEETRRGFVVRSRDGTALRYELRVAGRRLPLRRTDPKPAGASAYEAGLRVVRADARVRRGERVYARIRIEDAPPVTAGS